MSTNLTPEQRRRVTEWLAERVMGWKVERHATKPIVWVHDDAGDIWYLARPISAPYIRIGFWSPLDSGSDTMQVWEKAREKGIRIRLSGNDTEWVASDHDCVIEVAPSGPLAISLAVFRATGGVL